MTRYYAQGGRGIITRSIIYTGGGVQDSFDGCKTENDNPIALEKYLHAKRRYAKRI